MSAPREPRLALPLALALAAVVSASGRGGADGQQQQGLCRHGGTCFQDSVLLQRERLVSAPLVPRDTEANVTQDGVENATREAINVTGDGVNVTQAEGERTVLEIPCTIRDFKYDHPDFYLPEEGPPGRSFGQLKGCVKRELGPDHKPVFNENGTCFNSSASFAQWYTDVPDVNIRDNFTMEFLPNPWGGYTYDNASFFPFDGKAWGNQAWGNETPQHNYWFTMEMHIDFIYEKGSFFKFKGDDDVWVFINGSLAMDLGGIHQPWEDDLWLDDLDLVPGQQASLDFFFAERQPILSTFKVDMRLRLVGDSVNQLLPERTCMIWGDPHVNVFDSIDPYADAVGASVVNIFGHGYYWIAKGQDISIQGHYNATRWSIDGQSATRAIAIGGAFMRGHTLIIEAMDGKMTWDGKAILQEFPSSFMAEDIVLGHYHELEEPIDKAETHRPIHGVDLVLPLGVRVRVNRWAMHLDAVITMRPQSGGVDGHCGNLNFNATDDTLELISARMDLRVSAQDSLFPNASFDTAEVAEKSLADCAPEIREQAQAECEQKQVSSGGEVASQSVVEACIYDACFGGEDFVAH